MDQAILFALAAALVLLLLGAWLEAKRRAFSATRAARKLAKHGLKSEKDAEKLLKKLGYTLLQKQPPASYWAVVDGEPQAVQLAGDLLLEQNGQTFIAEVKTGKSAKLEHAETRRQLLEYQLAFGVDGLLLVDMDAKVVRSVRFPLPKKAGVAVVKAKGAVVRWLAVGALAVFAVWLIARAGHRPAGAEAADDLAPQEAGDVDGEAADEASEHSAH
jgi:hypothetical protein